MWPAELTLVIVLALRLWWIGRDNRPLSVASKAAILLVAFGVCRLFARVMT